MRSFITLAFLAGSALAAAPGSVCNTNVECNADCINSKWTIAAQTDGSYKFVCDSTTQDATQYYSSACNKVIGFDTSYDEGATAKACAKVGGVSCASACVSSGMITSENTFRVSWSNACGLTGLLTASVDAWDSEDVAKKVASCG
jgi:hypothetical protein